MPNPTIPAEIVIHLGAPDSTAQNVSESFPDYIKNVASSEIFPTWPREALKANILAQISVALNRVYTQFYRANGYDFDITSSPAYDQTYIYGRDIFENVSEIVDEIFNSYIRRQGNIEPLFAEFCDGVEVSCNGLEQWGSVRMAETGADYFSILKTYYGDDIEIVRNVPVEDTRVSAPDVVLKEGDTGKEVELIQRRLNRISVNYPGIPRIPEVDGFFDRKTTEAVIKFQEVFGLLPDGLVGKATWNEIQFIYNAVKKLYAVNSEGLKLSEVTTRYSDELKVGDSGEGVATIQYYLSYISLFVPTVREATLDGSYGEATAEAVRSFQRTYGLPVTGVVDRSTFETLDSVYTGIISTIDYEYRFGRILPFSGRVLREGVEGNDVRVLQEYLNFISDAYPEIPKERADGIFGPATAEQVRAFKELFGLPGSPVRVNAITWNAIADVYDDLYPGSATDAAVAKASDIRLPLSYGDRGEEVRQVKHLMSRLLHRYGQEGFYRIDGFFGQECVRGAEALRKIYHLPADSTVDQALYRAMKRDDLGG